MLRALKRLNGVKEPEKAKDAALKPANGQENQGDVVPMEEDKVVPMEVELKTTRPTLMDIEINCVELADDIYKYLVNHEKKFVLEEGFMNGGEPTNRMRKILIDWLVQVHSRFHLTPETLHLTVNILDFMLAKKAVGKSELQLLGVGAMFVATKFEEVFLPDIQDFAFVSEDAFDKVGILRMEQFILNSLDFDLSCPSILVFARSISRVLTENMDVDVQQYFITYNMSKCLAEYSFLDAIMSSVSKSHIAMAAMTIALQLCPVYNLSPEVAEQLMLARLGATKNDINVAVTLLAQVVLQQMKSEKIHAIRTKYQSSKLAKASQILATNEAAEILTKLIPQ